MIKVDPAPPKPRPPWRRRLVIYPALYLVFCAATFMGCTDRLLLHPSQEPIYFPGAERIDVATPGGGSIEVWARQTREARRRPVEAYVLAFIGNADRAEYALQQSIAEWEGRPVEVWAVNYPAFGGSSGQVSMQGSADAGLLAYDALAKRAGDRPIIVSGVSFGTAVALHAAANRPAAGLLLQNPPPLRQLILGRFGWWNLWLLAGPVALSVPSDIDSLANAARVQAPAVFVLAGADEIVPPQYQRRVVAAYAGEKTPVVLEGANHNDLPTGPGEADVQAGLDWLWSRAVGPAAVQPSNPVATAAETQPVPRGADVPH